MSEHLSPSWETGKDRTLQIKRPRFWIGDMVQWVEMLASKSDYLSSIPGAHMIKGKN